MREDDIEPRFPVPKLNATRAKPTSIQLKKREDVVKHVPSVQVTVRPRVESLFDTQFNILYDEFQKLQEKSKTVAGLEYRDITRMEKLSKMLTDASREERQRRATEPDDTDLTEEELRAELKQLGGL